MQSDQTTWVVLAHLLRPQGRKGEVLADLLTDFPERFVGREDLFLVPSDFTGDLSTGRRVEIASSWLPVGKNKGRVVLHFAGIDTIAAAEGFVGLDVVVPNDRRVPLDAESIYVSELIGCIVSNDSAQLGEIVNVRFPANSDGTRLPDAAPLLAVQAVDGGEVLIPFVKAFIKTIDLPGRRLVMSLPSGLVEVNQQA